MKRIFICILTTCVLCVFVGCKKPNDNSTQPTNAPANEPTAQITESPATPTGIETEEDDFTTPDNGENGTNNGGSGNGGSNGGNGNGGSGNGTNNGGNGNGGSNGNANTATPAPNAPDATPTPTDDGVIRLPEIGW